MPTPYPKEFRADVVAVARPGDQSIAKGARSRPASRSWSGSRSPTIADADETDSVDSHSSSSRHSSKPLTRPNHPYPTE